MTRIRPFLAPLLVLTTLLGAAAFGQEAALDQAVVRNKLHTVKGRFELDADFGLTLVNRLTEHYNFNLGAAYNFDDHWSLEVRGGYAISGQTSLAHQVAGNLLARAPSGPNAEVVTVNDLSNLWEMKGNVVADVRWAPVYGKISLLTELPVHYQAYLALGGGVASLSRTSVVYCKSVEDRASGTCADWLSDSRTVPMATGALGFRFFLGQHNAVKAELRNYVFQDSFLVNVDRSVAESGGTTGTPSPHPGFIDLVMLDVGYTYFF